MNNSTYPNNPQEAIFVTAQKCPYHVTFDLTLSSRTPWMQAYLETIMFKFGGDPVICLREEAMYMYIMYIMYIKYIVTNRLQYFPPASGRSNNFQLGSFDLQL